jgi:hypothetical protein
MILGGRASLMVKVVEVELKEGAFERLHDGFVRNKCSEKGVTGDLEVYGFWILAHYSPAHRPQSGNNRQHRPL